LSELLYPGSTPKEGVIYMVIGWKAGPEQYPPQELLDYAIAAEQAGFESIDASDHFHPWSDAGQASFIWSWLGAVAARTSKIELGTGLTCPILRYHPSVIAQAAATMGVLAPGRFYLAVGTGEALNEYSATGEWPGYIERQERLGEAIDLIRELWKGQPVTWNGKYYKTRKARLYTLPSQPVPLYISSLVPGSAAFAGKYGDGLLTVGGEAPEHYRQMLANFEQAARQAGKDPDKMPRLIELTVGYSEDAQAEISEHLKYWAGASVPAMYDQKLYTPAMSQQNGAVVNAETLKKKGLFSANPDEHAQFLRKYRELGFSHIYVHYSGPDQKRFLERYGRDVLPRAREAGGAQRESVLR
jgi:coenzyme F420-dependent glucose-6-phosphate dehydrogenase